MDHPRPKPLSGSCHAAAITPAARPPRPSLLPHRKAQKYHFTHALSSVYVVFSPAGPWFHEFRDPAPANLHGSPASTGLRCQVCPSSLCSIRTITPEAHRDIPASSIPSTNHRPAVAHEGQDRRVAFVTPKSRAGVAGGPLGRRYSGTRLDAGTVSEQTPARGGHPQTVDIHLNSCGSRWSLPTNHRAQRTECPGRITFDHQPRG